MSRIISNFRFFSQNAKPPYFSLQILQYVSKLTLFSSNRIVCLDKLTYATNDEIARLFTNLLTNASNEDRANLAHPSFVSMIERLSSDEARILNAMQKSNDILYCDFDEDVGGAYAPIFNHITAIQKYVKLQYPQNELAYLSNLESMGVLKDNFPKEKRCSDPRK